MTCENAENMVSYRPITRTIAISLGDNASPKPDWLAPFSREAEANPNKAKADNHVPGADIWDREASLSHIEDHNPEEADQEISDHYRG